jgi:hypothetical protein
MSYPKHAYPNARSFKAQKRRDLRALVKAADEFRMGCAYVPDQDAVSSLFAAIECLQSAMSAKIWGR